jgi:hypothetical protein
LQVALGGQRLIDPVQSDEIIVSGDVLQSVEVVTRARFGKAMLNTVRCTCIVAVRDHSDEVCITGNVLERVKRVLLAPLGRPCAA